MALHAEPVQHKPEYRLAHSRRNLFQSHPDGFPGMRATMSAKRRPPSCYLRGLFLIAVQRSKLDEHDRLAVADLSAADHVERLLDSDLRYLDILALFQLVAAQPFSVGGGIFRNEEEKLLGYRSWAHEGFEDRLRVRYLETGFFRYFRADRLGGVSNRSTDLADDLVVVWSEQIEGGEARRGVSGGVFEVQHHGICRFEKALTRLQDPSRLALDL
ncbi:hypothetical protein O3305_06930 [Sphingomonas sp. NIBR02145]|nr:hypothetical protein [Sphingomonas sp. NIBR02145]WHU04316.1 hypothetical protein O3305_06930 [Sphingomonas sp. NIBR02145]